MKKIIAIALVLCMMLGLCGCSGSASESQSVAVEPRGAEVDLDAIVEAIEKKLPEEGFKPEIGIVLGSGLHPLADEVEVVETIPYEELPGFPHSTVAGHEGKYILGYLEGIPVILMDGRIHYYEGYTMEQVVTPDRVMAKLGADTIILTNAVGSLKKELKPGMIACVKDHISSFIPNPLIGQNDKELGERFVPMSYAYDPELRKIAHETAKELNMNLPDSVYLQVTGPTYETTAESEFYASCGADTVGMSTACETIALRHMGVKVLCFNCVSNYCPNVSGEGTSHEEVQDTVDKMSKDLVKLVGSTVKIIAGK